MSAPADIDYYLQEEEPVVEYDIYSYNAHVAYRQSSQNPRGLYFGSHCSSSQTVLLSLLPHHCYETEIPLSAINTQSLVPGEDWSLDDRRFIFHRRGVAVFYAYYSIDASNPYSFR